MLWQVLNVLACMEQAGCHNGCCDFSRCRCRDQCWSHCRDGCCCDGCLRDRPCMSCRDRHFASAGRRRPF
ncbi:MAG: hypothetical protein FWE80_06565 [Oscillospiraceae bacterium]|nr:hypothetical protein [Oscillospiraceae bacterium]